MKPFAKTFDRIGTESAFAVGPEIAGWVKKGFDMVRLNIGEPGCNIPKAATDAIISSVKNHQSHYMPSAGTDNLREEIASYMKATRKVDYQLNDIVMTPGGKPVISGTIFILVDPGDEVIYPTPGYPIYESMIDFAGGKKVPIILREEKGFNFDIKDLKKLANKKTKLLILNSPSNPTGGVLGGKDLAEIAALARKYDFYILSDECYARIIFDGKFPTINYKNNKIMVTPSIASLPGMAQRTVILDGFSKTYSMTGLRLGYSCTKIPEFTKKMNTYAINIWSCLSAPLMAGAEACLGKNQKEAMAEVHEYKRKRDMAVKLLNSIKGIKCHNPLGSFYLFPNVTVACKNLKLKNSEELRKYLLSYDKKNKKGVAVLSRIHFGKPLPGEHEQYIRISFGGTYESVKEGILRIKEAVEK